MAYRQGLDYDSATTLSPSLQVSVYNSDSLPNWERKAIQLDVALSMEPLTSHKWDGGNEVRYITCNFRLDTYF